MWNLWKRFFTSTVLPTLLIFYILISVVIYRRSGEKISEKNEMKSLVGYSLEYQITEELKQTYKCVRMQTLKNVDGEKVNLEFDEYLNVFFVRAFFDQRLDPYNYVRTIALVPSNLTLFCQIWRNGENGDSRKATITQIWSDDWDKNQTVPYVPALISCLDSPGMVQSPAQISFTKQPCENSKFKIQIRAGEKRIKSNLTFTVCAKPVKFYDGINQVLQDWTAINKLLGVNKIVVYNTLYKNFMNVSQVNFMNFSTHYGLLKPGLSFRTGIWLKRKIEVLVYNDCFYDNLYSTDFIIPLDIDELIVPRFDKSLKEMFERYRKNNILEKVSSFSVKNVYFFKDYPEVVLKDLKLPLPRKLVNSSIFSRNVRSYYFSPGIDSTKSFIYVPNTLTIFNHFSYHVLGTSIRQIVIPTNVAMLHHYRSFCDSRFIENCPRYLNSAVYDNSLYRFVNFSEII